MAERRRTILTTDRLVLTTWLPGDVDELLAVHSDPETMRHVRHGRAETRAETVELVATYRTQQTGGGRTKWRLADADGRLVGRAGFGRTLAGWELGYTLRRDLWGRGLATEIAAALVDWHRAHSDGGRPDDLIAYVAEGNSASVRVLEKAGFVRTGVAEHSGVPCAFYGLPTTTDRSASRRRP